MGENKARQYDQLVTAIHAAVLEPAKWDGLLRRIGEAVGASAGGFCLRSRQLNDVPRWRYFGYSDASWLDYQQNHARHDPWMERLSRHPVGSWVAEHQCFSERELAQHDYFRIHLQGLGLHHLAGARVFDDGRSEGVMSFQRGLDDGQFASTELDFLERLAPHVELACRLSTEFARLSMQAAVARQALDRLAAPMWVADGDGKVIFANHAAEEGGVRGISVRNGRVQAEGAGAATKLANLLLLATQPRAQSGALALENPAGDRATVLVAPMPADSPLVADGRRPLALLMAHNRAGGDEQPLDVLAALYGLSPAECRLAALILEGCTPTEAAGRLSVQVSTVRTQLKSMFWKTGTHRQAELVKLLSGALLLKA